RAVVLAQAHAGLSATAGIHPHEARHWSAAAAARLRDLLALPEVVALGETGLDYHYDHSPRDAQRRAFEAQLTLAREVRKPAVVRAVAEALARARGESVAAIGQRTTDNARRLFGARLATTL